MWKGLPPKARRFIIDSKLCPGRLLNLFCDFTTPRKEKFLVLVCVNPEPWFFVINSEINDFKKRTPDLLRCQVPIDAANHNFLDHDSYIDCSQVHRITTTEIHRQLGADPDGIKTVLSPTVKANVISTVNSAKTLSPAEKTAIIAALKA